MMRLPGRIAPLVVLGLAAIAPLLATTGYSRTLLALSIIYALNVLGMHVIFGLTGILSLAQAAFWAIGAYTSAILVTDLGMPFLVGFGAAALVAAIAGVALGAPTLRLQTHYLVLATIAFAEVTRQIITNWSTLTRGPQGMPGIPRAEIFGFSFTTTLENYYLGIAVLTLVVLGLMAVRWSRLGRAMEAVRDDPLAAEAMGINVSYVRILAFSLSAAIGGLAGSLYAHMRGFISPETFNLHAAVLYLLILLIGGRRSLTGAIAGAFLVTYLPEWLRPLESWDMTIYGIGLLLILIFASDGITGSAVKMWRRIRGRQALQSLAGGGEP